MAQAIGSYGERFNGIEARFDAVDRRFTDVRADINRLDSKLDGRFNVQTVLMTVLGVLVLFGEPIRNALGL